GRGSMLDLARRRSGEPARWLLFSRWGRAKEKPGLPAPRRQTAVSPARSRRRWRWLRGGHRRPRGRRGRREDVPPAPGVLGAVESGVGGAEAGVQRRSWLGNGDPDAHARV